MLPVREEYVLPVREEYVLPVLFLFRPIPAEITSGRRGKGNQQAAHLHHAKGLSLMHWMTRKTKRNIRRAYPRRARNCPLEVQRYCPSSARKTPPALPMTQRGDINHERKTKGHTSKKDRQR